MHPHPAPEQVWTKEWQWIFTVCLGFPLADDDVLGAVHEATDELLKQLVSRTPVIVRGDILQQLREETVALYRDTSNVKSKLAVGNNHQKIVNQGNTEQVVGGTTVVTPGDRKMRANVCTPSRTIFRSCSSRKPQLSSEELACR